jgi:uracil-DNA glycosylase
MSQTALSQIKIEQSWLNRLNIEFEKPYFIKLKQFLIEERKAFNIFPKGAHIFEAFNRTPFDNVKVVLLGQDPYHGLGQAHGLCFSVTKGTKLPPSLKNIYKEMEADMGISPALHGDLSSWADDGVFLLNSTLTVRENNAGSHQGQGWEIFTDEVIRIISQERKNVVFILWGKFAQSKSVLIDSSKHLVLQAAHPSPFSAYNGFFGCKHFSKTNEYLTEKGIKPVNWVIN